MNIVTLVAIAAVAIGSISNNIISEIPAGVTKLNISDDAEKITITKAWRENYNAHSYYVISFLKEAKTNLQVINIDDKDSTKDFLTTNQGADCTLTDYRLLKTAKALYLIKGQRAAGDNYASVEKVTFTTYKLQKNTDQEPGAPEYSFVNVGSKAAAKTYCDVNEAFKAENQSLIQTH